MKKDYEFQKAQRALKLIQSLKEPLAIRFEQIVNERNTKEIADKTHKAELRKDKQTKEKILRDTKQKKEQKNRGLTKTDDLKQMNFFFIWGCRPSAGVGANTDMIKDIYRAFMEQQEPIDASVSIPSIFDYLSSSDASFETASSNQLQHLQLFYAYNLVTNTIGVIFYHNHTETGELVDKLQSNKSNHGFNLITPCYRMLKNYIDLERVHIFGDLSPSQILEKFNWIEEMCLQLGNENRFR